VRKRTRPGKAKKRTLSPVGGRNLGGWAGAGKLGVGEKNEARREGGVLARRIIIRQQKLPNSERQTQVSTRRTFRESGLDGILCVGGALIQLC